jgi:diaminohydroxyphosphoribosylaminopyrimidine deaminase/5-amino-6-(5-phosphoribosylamino)uracil reductase
MARFSEFDRTSMGRALDLARAVRGRTFPNPAVGAVIVSDGEVVGEGATAPAGGPHAERTAVSAAGRRTQGATLYVTLEPCCHYGRTPPCTDAILEAGIARVVAAVTDPNPEVAGRGVSKLRRSGVRVEVGLLGDQAASLNEDFFFAVVHGRAWITVKLALTLDGRLADVDGASQWITGPAARRLAHEVRRQHAAIAVGRGTLDADSPRLTVRHGPPVRPARLVFASHASAASLARFQRAAPKHRTVVVMAGGRCGTVQRDQTTGLEIWHTGPGPSAQRLDAFCRLAWQQGLPSVLVEGGRDLASAFLEAGLVNRFWGFYGPRLLGGGRAGLAFHAPRRLADAITLGGVTHVALDGDWAVTGLIDRAPSPRGRRRRRSSAGRGRVSARGRT